MTIWLVFQNLVTNDDKKTKQSMYEIKYGINGASYVPVKIRTSDMWYNNEIFCAGIYTAAVIMLWECLFH